MKEALQTHYAQRAASWTDENLILFGVCTLHGYMVKEYKDRDNHDFKNYNSKKTANRSNFWFWTGFPSFWRFYQAKLEFSSSWIGQSGPF